MLGLFVGILVGFLMSIVAPGFAIALLGNRADGIAPSQLCIGLGLANGPALGLAGGISVIIAEAIYSSRKAPDSK